MSANVTTPQELSRVHRAWTGLTVDRIFLAVALLVFFGSQLLLISLPFIESDEAAFGACAARQLSFSILPLTKCVDVKTPGIFTLYQIIYSLFGTYTGIGLRLVSIAAVLLNSILLFRITRHAVNEDTARIAAGIFLLTVSTSNFFLALKTELIVVLFLQLAIIFLLQYQRTRNLKALAYAGVLLALATLFKQPAVLFFGAISIALIFVDKAKFQVKQWIMENAVVGISGSGPILIVTMIYLGTGHWAEFFDHLWQRPRIYAEHGAELFSPWHNFLEIRNYLFSPLVILSIIGMLVLLSRSFLEYSSPLARVKPLMWWFVPITLTSMIAISLGGHYFSSYYMMILPFLVLIIAVFFAPVSKYAFSSPFVAAGLWILTSAAGFLSINQAKLLQTSANNSRQMAREIERVSSPGDSLYVWGYVPELYPATGMIPASRFVTTSMIVGYFHEVGDNRSPERQLQFVMKGDWDKFMQDLQDAENFVFVDTSAIRMGAPGNFAPMHYPRLKKFMNQYCQLQPSTLHFPVYRCSVK